MLKALSILLTAPSLFALTAAQCPNAVANFNPNLRTMSANFTWFLVPVPAAAAKKAVDESYPQGAGGQALSLLPLPASAGFPAGTHPVLTYAGYSADVRMSALQIDGNYMTGSVIVPFIGKGGSSTPLQAVLINYLAGTTENTAGQLGTAGIVPSLVSTLVEGLPTRLGSFLPSAAALQVNNNNILSVNTKWVVVPNPVSGPGVYIEALDLAFITDPSPQYSLSFLKSTINQPLLLQGAASGQCTRNTFYFGNATAAPVLRAGNVTFGPGADGAGLLSGTLQSAVSGGAYIGAHGLSACAQNVGFNNQDCEEAARQVDPAA